MGVNIETFIPPFELAYQSVDGTIDASAGISYSDISEMTLTVAKTGTYFVIFDMQCNINATGSVRLLKNVTKLKESEYSSVSGHYHVGMNQIISCSVGDIIKMQWKNQDVDFSCPVASTPTEFNRSLTILKIT